MLPNLIVIGAAKSGTTSLHFYLDRHPEIAMAKTKELNFFTVEQNWGKGVDWYESRFRDARIRGESSPRYTTFPIQRGVPERIHGVVPDAQLLYLVRDPVDRAVSDYVHGVAAGTETRAPEIALTDEESRYVARSRYTLQLEQYLPFFPLERILVVSHDDLLRARAETLRSVFASLGVDPTFTSPAFALRHQASRWKRRKTPLGRRLARLPRPPLAERVPSTVRWYAAGLAAYPFSRRVPVPVVDARLRARMTDLLAADAARFRELTGRAFPNWTV